jgi:hypothetical protein
MISLYYEASLLGVFELNAVVKQSHVLRMSPRSFTQVRQTCAI